MKLARIILLLLATLPLIGACALWWVAATWPPGTFFWSHHVRTYVARFDDGSELGVDARSSWNVQWGYGRIALANHLEEYSERQPYTAPAGFPYDVELARQIRGEWEQDIRRTSASLAPRGYHLSGEDLGDTSGSHRWWERWGFVFDWPRIPRPLHGPPVRSMRRKTVQLTEFPGWAMVVLLAFPTLGVVRVILRRLKRYTGGRCLACGYDLRASATVCPECGEPITTSGRTSALSDEGQAIKTP